MIPADSAVIKTGKDARIETKCKSKLFKSVNEPRVIYGTKIEEANDSVTQFLTPVQEVMRSNLSENTNENAMSGF